MTGRQSLWRVHLAAAAEADFRDIMQWTLQQFGETQASVYAQTLSVALTSLSEGLAAHGVRARNDIAKGFFTLHVARKGFRGRHFVLFRLGSGKDQQIVEVLRILHDAMDMARHIPPDQD